MMRRSPVPPSPAFEAAARGVRFRDRIAVVVKAPPEVIFRALHEVTLRDMKVAWLLGELRYLPSRLAGHMPAADSRQPFMDTLVEGGTLVLRDDAPREVITGSAAQLHRVHQTPQRFANREAFEAFDDPGYEKLFMSVRAAPTGRPGEQWLVLEHATRALSPLAERKFARYWRAIKPLGAFVTRQLLRAVRRRAERAAAGPQRPGVAAGITRHPVPAYFALTFAISWGLALLAIGGSGGMRGTTPTSDPRFAYAVMAMLAGPSVTGILLTALVGGRAGLREFLSRLLRWRVGAVWYAVALLTAPVVMTATLLALSSISPAFVPGIFISDHKASLVLVSLAVGLAAGVFEEPGWTGFAIPTVRRRHGVVASGLIVGIWWSAWHLLPNVWSSRAAYGDLAVSVFVAATAFGVFVGYLTAFRVLMVWVYDRTESLFVAVLMHVSITASLLILNPLGISGVHLLAYSFALAAAVWIVVAVVAVVGRGRFRSQPLRTSAA